MQYHAALAHRLLTLTGAPPEAPSDASAPTHDMALLVAQVSQDWQHAWRHAASVTAERARMEHLHAELTTELACAQDALSHGKASLAGAEQELDVVEWQCQRRHRQTLDEVSASKAERNRLLESNEDWRRKRPQLEELVDQLRIENENGAASRQELTTHLAAMRSTVEQRKRLQIGKPICDDERDSEGSASDEPPVTLQSLAEEHDNLHKEILALEDDKRNLIQEQE